MTVSRTERTAHDVAQRYLGDRALWLEVVRLNKMTDARTKNDGTPLTTNDSLLVPLAGGVPNIGDVYGTSVLIRDGDIVCEGGTSTVMVTGVDNLYQNHRHRMQTVRGTNKAFPSFGLPPVIGTVETTDVPGQLLSAVRLQTLADHRVRGIAEMSLTEEADKLVVDYVIETVTGDKESQMYIFQP